MTKKFRIVVDSEYPGQLRIGPLESSIQCSTVIAGLCSNPKFFKTFSGNIEIEIKIQEEGIEDYCLDEWEEEERDEKELRNAKKRDRANHLATSHNDLKSNKKME